MNGYTAKYFQSISPLKATPPTPYSPKTPFPELIRENHAYFGLESCETYPFPPIRIRLLVIVDGKLQFDNSPWGLSKMLHALLFNPQWWVKFYITCAHRQKSKTLKLKNILGKDIRNSSICKRIKEHDNSPFRFERDTICTKGRNRNEVRFKFDQIWFFGTLADTDPLQPHEVDILRSFMDAGYGVFATADHGLLGNALCGRLPRVRRMLHFSKDPLPNTTTHRNNTVHPRTPPDPLFPEHQSDEIPLSLNVRYYYDYQLTHPLHEQQIVDPLLFRRYALPHPILSMPWPLNEVNALPDHPHEGEVLECTKEALEDIGAKKGPGIGPFVNEFPYAARDSSTSLPQEPPRLPWEIVGSTFNRSTKLLVDRNFQEDQTQGDRPPSEFGAVGAYNGFLALDPVGRIAVDSSFHHWTNLNLRGWPDWHRLGEAQKKENLTREEEQAFANIKKIRGYYTNLATWLAPWETQRLISVHAIASSIQRTPLEEALPDPPPHNLANYLRFGQLTIYHLLPLVAETHIRTWWIYFLEPGQAGSLLDEHNLRVDFHLEVLDECLLGAIVLWYWEYWWKDGRLPNVEDLIVVADEAIRSGWEHYKRAYITQTKKASEALIKRIDKLLYPTPGP